MIRLIFITTICVFIVSTLFGQSFPGDNPELLLNKTVKPKEIDESLQKYAYKNFFLEFNKEKKQFTKDEKRNKPFPSGPSYSVVSDYNKLVGKEFKVIDIYEIVSQYSYSNKVYAIEIENNEIGTIFYKYDPKYEYSFELSVVGGLDYPEGYFCDKIEHKVDKFENKETFYTPTENGISFIKTIENGNSIIYLSVRENGSTLNYDIQGLYILFSDGSKFTKPNEEIDVDVSSGSGWIYSAFINLSQEEMELLSEKNITDTKLYIYEGTVDNESATKIREYLKCLMK
jgi:hypothetical protein